MAVVTDDSTTAKPTRKVLVISAHIGAGHGQAARAVLDSLRSRPGVDARHVEVLDYAGRFFRAYYQGGFILGMTRLQWAYGLGFRLSDRADRPGYTVGERIRLMWERFLLRRLSAKIIRQQPDLVISTHFLVPPLVRKLVKKGLLRTKQMVVVTDHQVHRWWYCPDVDQWFVPSDQDLDRYVRWGVPRERITVAGIPVHAKWTRPLDRAAVRAEWRLPADGPVVVLSGGTEFTCGPVVQIAQGILAACPQACLVVLAGRNKELLASLSGLAKDQPRLVPVSFTDRANELVGLASLMITKPGGVTTAECAAVGTPMVLLRPVPGQEASNARYYASHGAAVITTDAASIIAAVRRLLSNEAELAAMASAAKALYRPATQIVADAVARALDPAATGG